MSRSIQISGGALAPRLPLPKTSAFAYPSPLPFFECDQHTAAPSYDRHTAPTAAAAKDSDALTAKTDTVQGRRGGGPAGIPNYIIKEIEDMLEIISNVEPLDDKEWALVTSRSQQWTSANDSDLRDAESLENI